MPARSALRDTCVVDSGGPLHYISSSLVLTMTRWRPGFESRRAHTTWRSGCGTEPAKPATASRSPPPPNGSTGSPTHTTPDDSTTNSDTSGATRSSSSTNSATSPSKPKPPTCSSVGSHSVRHCGCGRRRHRGSENPEPDEPRPVDGRRECLDTRSFETTNQPVYELRVAKLLDQRPLRPLDVLQQRLPSVPETGRCPIRRGCPVPRRAGLSRGHDAVVRLKRPAT